MTPCLQIERQLGNVERVRTLYEKYLEWSPANCTAWCKFAEFEQQYLAEVDRARGIYELAITQPILDMPEVLWKVRTVVVVTTKYRLLRLSNCVPTTRDSETALCAHMLSC